jgi:hypothetical protein
MEKDKEQETAKELENSFREIEEKLKQDSITKDQLYEWFKEEIDRKDAIIDKLKKDNHVLFKTALKANEKALDDQVAYTNNERDQQ